MREIAQVTTAVAQGDLTKTVNIEAKGEILELKNTINTMVEQLGSFASEVTRVAREVGTEGSLGGQAQVRGVSGVWRELTQNVNSMANNLTTQVRNIAEVATAIAAGDLSRKITVEVKGEMLELKETINTMVDQLGAFAAEVTRVAREVGTEGVLGGQAKVAGGLGRVARADRERELDGQQPDQPGAQHRRGHHRHRPGRPGPQDRRRRPRRDPHPQEHHQRHRRQAEPVRRRGDPGGPPGRHRRDPGRAGRRQGRVAASGRS